jgi:hypothetical protein
MPEEFLDGPDIIAILKQVRGETGRGLGCSVVIAPSSQLQDHM